eukprot:1022399-Prorocentrum_minimum.AAC.1
MSGGGRPGVSVQVSGCEMPGGGTSGCVSGCVSWCSGVMSGGERLCVNPGMCPGVRVSGCEMPGPPPSRQSVDLPGCEAESGSTPG